MAGRGTDIKLGEGVSDLGGLKIIGTERHESRRIDNQLRGRSGRQGDRGESKFYLSLEDDLMRLFGSEKVMAVYDTLNIPEGEEIQHKTITRFIEKAQKKIESNNYAIRKNLMQYDEVNNEQREIIYAERRRVLDGENMRDVVYKMVMDTVEAYIDKAASDEVDPSEWDMKELNDTLRPIIPFTEPIALTDKEKETGNVKLLKQRLKEEAGRLYEAKEAEFPNPETMREIERVILLKVIDRKWMAHIDDMAQLKTGIGLQSFGSKDPVVEYKFAGYDMFNDMTASIQEDTARMILHVRIEEKVEREQVAKVTGTNKDDSVKKGPVKRASAKVGRNDPCPCGSGKKYKMCCGRNL
jgi:preprotein translocase subunit SecA